MLKFENKFCLLIPPAIPLGATEACANRTARITPRWQNVSLLSASALVLCASMCEYIQSNCIAQTCDYIQFVQIALTGILNIRLFDCDDFLPTPNISYWQVFRVVGILVKRFPIQNHQPHSCFVWARGKHKPRRFSPIMRSARSQLMARARAKKRCSWSLVRYMERVKAGKRTGEGLRQRAHDQSSLPGVRSNGSLWPRVCC